MTDGERKRDQERGRWRRRGKRESDTRGERREERVKAVQKAEETGERWRDGGRGSKQRGGKQDLSVGWFVQISHCADRVISSGCVVVFVFSAWLVALRLENRSV